MSLKQAYYYLFYKLYKIAMHGAIKSLSSFYAEVGIMALEIWFFMSLFNYYSIFFNRYATIELKSIKGIAPLIIILVVNYFIFDYKNKWKKYVTEFDTWPKKRNKIGGIIVFSVIILIVANLIFSFYLTSLIDWQQYRRIS